MDKLKAAWAAIPVYIRSVLNVGVVGSVAVITGQVISHSGVTGVDWTLTGQRALDAFGLGIAVAVVRLLNPLETQYGGVGAAPGTANDGPPASNVPLDSLSDIDSSDGTEVVLDPANAPVESAEVPVAPAVPPVVSAPSDPPPASV